MGTNVIVVGGGRVGGYLATLLLSAGHKVKVIEARPEENRHLRRDLPQGVVVEGNGTDPDVLERTGIAHANVVAAVTGADETNLVVMGLARFEFKVPRTIARVKDPRNAWMFTPEMGVDAALNQADLLAHLVAEEMSQGDMMTLLKLRRGQYSLVEEKVHPAAVAADRAVRDLKLPDRCVLAAVIRKGQLMIPRPELVLQPADEIVALAHASQLAQLAGLLAAREKRG